MNARRNGCEHGANGFCPIPPTPPLSLQWMWSASLTQSMSSGQGPSTDLHQVRWPCFVFIPPKLFNVSSCLWCLILQGSSQLIGWSWQKNPQLSLSVQALLALSTPSLLWHSSLSCQWGLTSNQYTCYDTLISITIKTNILNFCQTCGASPLHRTLFIVSMCNILPPIRL